MSPDIPDMGASRSATGLQPTGARATVYRPVTFDAYRYAHDATDPIYRVSLRAAPASLQDAINAALSAQAFYAKDKLIVRETSEAGEVKLHLYAIKRQSRPTYEYRDYQTRPVHRHYAEPICILSGEVLK